MRKKQRDNTFSCCNTPSVAARVIAAEFSLELTKLGVRKLVQGHFVRAHNFAEHIDLAESNLADHVDELAKLNLPVAARVDFLDQRNDLLWRQVLTEVLERRGDLGLVNAVDAASSEFNKVDGERGAVCGKR